MIRIGKSTDVHKLECGKPLIIGGVKIPHNKGNVGHSDGDCLLHTVCESLLGALALGDLGALFPDTSEEFRGIASSKLVQRAMQLVEDAGYRVVNIDSTVFLQAPKLRPYINEIRLNIALLLNIDISQVSVKATTTEKLGAIGEGNAIASESVVLVTNDVIEK
jgi:2-C-methyl-D-erythritol 2,4-cyclodiphosphate synthase